MEIKTKRKRFRVNAEACSDNYRQHRDFVRTRNSIPKQKVPFIKVFGKLQRIPIAQVANLKQQFEIIYR